MPIPYPLHFAEVVCFLSGPASGECSTANYLKSAITPKGLGYLRDSNTAVVSLIVEGDTTFQRTTELNTVGIGDWHQPAGQAYGSRLAFGLGAGMMPVRLERSQESKIAVVPAHMPQNSFTPGDVFVGDRDAAHGLWQVAQLSSAGTLLNGSFVSGKTDTLTLSVSMTFGDDTAPPGLAGLLLVMTVEGLIYTVSSGGGNQNMNLLVDLRRWIPGPPFQTDGLVIAPPDFGPLSGHILIGMLGTSSTDPNAGTIWAVDYNNIQRPGRLLADIGFAVEGLAFVPKNCGTYYQVESAYDRGRENRLLCASSSQFLARTNHLIAVSGCAGALWDISWDAKANGYPASPLGRVPGRWTTQDIGGQGTQIKQGVFAQVAPTPPLWTSDYLKLDGLTTAVSPAAAGVPPAPETPDVPGLEVLATDPTGHIQHNQLNRGSNRWIGWLPLMPMANDITTKLGPACVYHDQTLYGFAVRDPDHQIMFVRLDSDRGIPLTWQPIASTTPVTTDAALSATSCNGRIVLAARESVSGQVFLTEMAIGGRNTWNQAWAMVPNSPALPPMTAPTVVAFQGELYVFIVDPTQQNAIDRVKVAVRSANGVWTPWSNLPLAAGLTTDQPLAATAFVSRPSNAPRLNQLHLFGSDLNSNHDPSELISSVTGTWGTWGTLPNNFPKATKVAMAAAEFDFGDVTSLRLVVVDGANNIWVRSTL